MNPITALAEQFEKLINEHGSAAILRDHLALIKDKSAIFEGEKIKLESENSSLQTKIQALEEKNQQLAVLNEDLKNKINAYENPIHSELPSDERINILKFLSEHSNQSVPQISQAVTVGEEVANFHLTEMKKINFVRSGVARARNGRATTGWSLDQEGRRLLIENKIIS
jgi:hypothetical protein